jgi:succinyl-CoA synthetase beta subunit
MHLHEHQAKQLFSRYGIPVPEGVLLEDAAVVADMAVGQERVVKAQVHAGGRGKGGGVRLVKDATELAAAVKELLGCRLVTRQTGPAGLPVNSVLVEQTVAIAREIYLGMLVDRARERVTVMVSAAGGMDIETVAATNRRRSSPSQCILPRDCRDTSAATWPLPSGWKAARSARLPGSCRPPAAC